MLQVYFDGLQSMGITGPIHYTAPLVQRAFSRHVKRDVIVQSSELHPFSWHIATRSGESLTYATRPRASSAALTWPLGQFARVEL